MTTNQPRAYIVHATPEQWKTIHRALSSMDYNDSCNRAWAAVATAKPLDIDALRLVLEAASCERERDDELANSPHGDMQDRERADKLGDAIAKIEAII